MRGFNPRRSISSRIVFRLRAGAHSSMTTWPSSGPTHSLSSSPAETTSRSRLRQAEPTGRQTGERERLEQPIRRDHNGAATSSTVPRRRRRGRASATRCMLVPHSAISRARMPVAPATPARSFRCGISHHFPTAPTRPQGSGFHCDIPTATTRRNRARARPESESMTLAACHSRVFAEYHPDRAWRAER